MNVPIEADWILPCTLLVARELERTLPEACWPTAPCWIRSAKLVSVPLKAVVCELAMLPEMFCSAKDCAFSPATALVRASKIPMIVSTRDPGGRREPGEKQGPQLARKGHRKPRASDHPLQFQ